MKRILIALSVILGCMTNLSAQIEQPTDELPLPDSIKYVFPEFKPGFVVLKDGTRSSGTFNISTWYQELLFKDNDGNIQALADNAQVDMVTVGGTMFYYDKESYIGVMDIAGDVMLCSSRKLVFDDRKEGAYGMKSATTATQSITIGQSSTGSIVHFTPDTEYWLKDEPYIYRKNKFQIPTKKVILKAFPSHADAIEAYFQEHNVNTASLDDLKALFAYINTL